MIGGLVGRPVANSTGPGRPIPTPTTSPRRRPARRTSTRLRSTTHVSTFSGPTATSRSTTSSASTVAARSVTARRTWVAPTSTPRTSRARGLKANRAGGRPPVDVASPAAPTSSLVTSASTRWATVERPRPGGGGELAARARRTVAEQLEERPRTVGSLPPHGRIEPHRLSLAPGRLLLDKWQKSSRVDGSRRHAGTWRRHRCPDHQEPSRRHLARTRGRPT